MARTPITATHSFVTRPMCIFVDELTKPKIHVPTVLKDSSVPIRLLNSFVLPNKDFFLVTADVTLLYPNVDTKPLTALDLLLCKARTPETLPLTQVARLVLKTVTYLKNLAQIFFIKSLVLLGAHLVLSPQRMCLCTIIRRILSSTIRNIHLTLYKPFIDDTFAIWCGPEGTLLEFHSALNNKNHWVKLTYCINETSIFFLDLFLFRDASSDKLQFSTF